MTVIERLMLFLESKNMKPARAEKECGFSNGLLGNAYRMKASIGSDKLEKILNTYPELSAEWLMRGVGPMIIGGGIAPEQLFRMLNMPPDSDKIIDKWKQFMNCMDDLLMMYKNTSS